MTDIPVDSLINQLSTSKRIYDNFSVKFKNSYKIADKLMSEWRAEFHVAIPPDLNTQTCILLDRELMKLYETASGYKAEAEAQLVAYKEAYNEQYRGRYALLCSEYRSKQEKLPAKDTLATMVESDLSDLKSAQAHAEIELSFWKEILNDLYYKRKLVDNSVMALGIEAKALISAHHLNKLNEGEH